MTMNPLLSLRSAARRGRPRQIDLSDAQKQALAALYLSTNATRDSGSMAMAWALFCERERLAWDPMAAGSKHNLPTCAVEVMKDARRFVRLHRGGERQLRQVAYTPGRMRVSECGTRRLYAGEQASWDDGTINMALWIPWPWGGDRCSDRFHMRLGRFQLLLCHDDATSYVPAWTFVMRERDSYRAADVASGMLRVSRDVCVYDRFVLEGGVWKANRVDAVLDSIGTERGDASGRPQCKLVENYFNRLWTRMSICPGQVGRFRGEERKMDALWNACRAGREDPSKHFPSLDDAMKALEESIGWLNRHPIESREYGRWVPAERWALDMEQHPRQTMQDDLLWLASPMAETRTVTRGMLTMTADSILGARLRYRFSSPWLWKHAGERLTAYYDPMGEWPVKAHVTREGDTKLLGVLECCNPAAFGGHGEDHAKAVRACMRREYRLLLPEGTKRETYLRTPDRTLELTRGTVPQAPIAAEPEPQPDITIPAWPVRNPEPEPSAPAALPSLARRAKAAATAVPNW